MNGVYFALRSGDEHRNLRHSPSQIELIEKSGERAFLRYTEDISKNHPGGLKGRKQNPKVAVHYENVENPSRCFVCLHKPYNSKCPPNRPAGAFYLKPLKNTTGAYWYGAQPIGHQKLNSTVARMCKAAGIQGFKTNHSLRATAATRLYQAGVDEQIIMETTGHKSTDGVRCYKRTSAQQRESVSDILSLAKRPRPNDLNFHHDQHVSQTPSTETHQQDLLQRMFNFNQCSDLSINVQIINK